MSEIARRSDLPILDEIGVALYAAAVAADRRRARRARLAGAGRLFRRPLVVAIAVMGVSGTVGGLALAGTFAGGTIGPQAWVDGQRVAPTAAPTPDETAILGILRRPRVSSDALPPYYSKVLPNSPTGGGDGVNIDLSRRAYGFPDGAAAWVIPGNDGTICLVAANAEAVQQAGEAGPALQHVPAAQDSVNCEPIAQVQTGWPLSFGSGPGDTPGVFFTAGVVPDGVQSVTVQAAGGSVTMPVHDNVWLGYVHGPPETETFTGPNGPVTIGGTSS